MVGLDDLRGLFQPVILWFYDSDLPFSIWSSTLPTQAYCDVWYVWKGRPTGLLVLTYCAVFLITQTSFAALVMTGNMMWVIMQSSLVTIQWQSKLEFMHLLLLAKVFFTFENLWSIKDLVVLCPSRAVPVTASWPNFMNVVSLSTSCRIPWRGCCSSLHALKWHRRLLWNAK